MRPSLRLDGRASPALALLPLRLFLGATFVYAGVQKLSDPGFLMSGAPTYIGTQLQAFAAGTPGGFILRTFALPIPKVAGVGVALLEIGIGLLAFFGLFTRLAALAGLALNLLLFLTASWKTRPYFLGPDLVFVFAWLPFVLAAAAGQPALEHLSLRALRIRREGRRPVLEIGEALTRRTFLRRALGATGFLTALLAGGSLLSRGSYEAPPAHAAPPKNGGGAAGAGTRIAAAGDVAPGAALVYSDPADGTPDIVIRQASGDLAAFSAVCTHAGCQVSYQGDTLFCPCHGAVYSAETGAVEGGPAPAPLAPKHVVERGGQIYAL